MATCIPQTPIAVDFWQKNTFSRVFFLSHMHADHTQGLSQTWNRPIYCSQITRDLAMLKFQIPVEMFHVLEHLSPKAIALDEEREEYMTVTALDANHIPGALMFLFQGYFGAILHTGDFRFAKSMLAPESPLSKTEIDTVYLDNTYLERTGFPSRDEAVQSCIEHIENHPGHEIHIALRNFGKEYLLCRLASHFRTPIITQAWRLEQFRLMGLPPSTFTLNPSEGFIHTSDFWKYSTYDSIKKRPVLTIVPTALDSIGVFSKRSAKTVFVPLSDHSSHRELLEFIGLIKPKRVQCIVKQRNGRSDHWLFRYQHLLRRTNDTIPFDDQISIPETVKRFMDPGTGGENIENTLRARKRTLLSVNNSRKPVLRKRIQLTRGIQFESLNVENSDIENSDDEVEFESPHKPHLDGNKLRATTTRAIDQEVAANCCVNTESCYCKGEITSLERSGSLHSADDRVIVIEESSHKRHDLLNCQSPSGIVKDGIVDSTEHDSPGSNNMQSTRTTPEQNTQKLSVVSPQLPASSKQSVTEALSHLRKRFKVVHKSVVNNECNTNLSKSVHRNITKLDSSIQPTGRTDRTPYVQIADEIISLSQQTMVKQTVKPKADINFALSHLREKYKVSLKSD